jgi:pyruvate/2-oxoglutarate dehydrogenase complex dihydrolipoamide acyltransferase (E2) component
MKEVILPDMGEEVKEATISFWHHDEGDKVTKGEDLVEITTEKASFQVEVPVSGVLSKISAGEGEVVKSGQVLGIIEEI